MKTDKRKITLKVLIYVLGIICVSEGIVLCKKCNLGISPISSIPFVLEKITNMSFGTLTMLFHFVNIIIQMILYKKLLDKKVLLQIPLAYAFGFVIDILQKINSFEANKLIISVICLILSILLTGLGMYLMISMNLIQNPPDGTVRLISIKTGREMGKVKITYDISCCIISIAIGAVCMGKPVGMGIATLCSAIFVGKVLSLLKNSTVCNRIMCKVL